MNQKINLRLLYLFNFLKSLQFFGALAVPFYTVRLGFSYSQMFSLEAIFSIMLFVFEIPTGVVADKCGRKISLFVGTIILGFSFLLYGFFYNYIFLVLIQVLCALGLSLITGADKALVYEVAKTIEDTPLAIVAKTARFDSFGTFGMLIAFPVGSFFVSLNLVEYTHALGLVFVATGVSILISVLLLVGLKENPRPPLKVNPLVLGFRGFVSLFRNKEITVLSLNTASIVAQYC